MIGSNNSTNKNQLSSLFAEKENKIAASLVLDPLPSFGNTLIWKVKGLRLHTNFGKGSVAQVPPEASMLRGVFMDSLRID